MPLKQCTKCKKEYPATADHFHRNRSRKSGLEPKCKSCSLEDRKAWRESHRDRWNAYAKSYADGHRERVREQYRAYHKANPELARERKRRWRNANPEAAKATAQLRRSRKRNAGGAFTGDDIAKLFELQKGRCWWNTNHRLDKGYHVDHRIALAKGGTNDISNIVLACPRCNLSKNDRMPDEFAGRLL